MNGPFGLSHSEPDRCSVREMSPAAPSTRDWFRDDELEHCPRCDQKAALAVPEAAAVVCTECGVVDFPGADGPPRLVDDVAAAKDAA